MDSRRGGGQGFVAARRILLTSNIQGLLVEVPHKAEGSVGGVAQDDTGWDGRCLTHLRTIL